MSPGSSSSPSSRGRFQVSVVVPAWRAGAVLDRTIASLGRYLSDRHPSHEILVVDDGSPDDTVKVARRALERAHGRLIRHPEPRGVGAAVRTGALAAEGRWLLVVEADLATPVESQADLARVCRDRDLDGAIGSRDLSGSAVEDRRGSAARALDRGVRAAVRAIADLESRDPCAAFAWLDLRRVRPLLEQMVSTRSGWTAELRFLAARLGVELAEVPVSWRSAADRPGDGPAEAVRTIAEVARVRWRFRRGRYVGGPRERDRA